MSKNKPRVSFDTVNKQLESMLIPTMPTASKAIVDNTGSLITFGSHREYLDYLDQRDWRESARQ